MASPVIPTDWAPSEGHPMHLYSSLPVKAVTLVEYIQPYTPTPSETYENGLEAYRKAVLVGPSELSTWRPKSPRADFGVLDEIQMPYRADFVPFFDCVRRPLLSQVQAAFSKSGFKDWVLVESSPGNYHVYSAKSYSLTKRLQFWALLGLNAALLGLDREWLRIAAMRGHAVLRWSPRAGQEPRVVPWSSAVYQIPTLDGEAWDPWGPFKKGDTITVKARRIDPTEDSDEGGVEDCFLGATGTIRGADSDNDMLIVDFGPLGVGSIWRNEIEGQPD